MASWPMWEEEKEETRSSTERLIVVEWRNVWAVSGGGVSAVLNINHL